MIRCLNCGTHFNSLAAYERHQYRRHAVELDQGTVFQ